MTVILLTYIFFSFLPCFFFFSKFSYFFIFFFFSISFFFSHLWSFLTTDDTIAGQQSFPMPTIPLSSTTLYSLLLSFFFPAHHHPPHLSLWPPLFHLYLTSTTVTMDTLSFHHPSSNGFNNMDNPHSLIFMSYI